MDIICCKCGDPVDNDTLHDLVEEGTYPNYQTAARAFRAKGCKAIGFTCNPGRSPRRADVASVLYDLLGSDMDGAANMFEDMGL